jgi:hypothetical protein
MSELQSESRSPAPWRSSGDLAWKSLDPRHSSRSMKWRGDAARAGYAGPCRRQVGLKYDVKIKQECNIEISHKTREGQEKQWTNRSEHNDLHVNSGRRLVPRPRICQSGFSSAIALLPLYIPSLIHCGICFIFTPVPDQFTIPFLYVPVCAILFVLVPSDQRSGQPESNSSDFPVWHVLRSLHSDRLPFPVPLRLGLRLRDWRSDLARGLGSVLKKGGR